MSTKKKIDWIAVENEYITGTGSYRGLQKKYTISMTALSRRAKAGKWASRRKQYRHVLGTKSREKILDAAILNKAQFDAGASRAADTALQAGLESMSKAGKLDAFKLKGMREALDLVDKATDLKYKLLGVPARSEFKGEFKGEFQNADADKMVAWLISFIFDQGKHKEFIKALDAAGMIPSNNPDSPGYKIRRHTKHSLSSDRLNKKDVTTNEI